jgi:hypothetical protein
MQKTLMNRSTFGRARAFAGILTAVGSLSLSACMADVGDEQELELIATEEGGLRSSTDTLPWRGNTPLFPGVSSGRTNVLSVIYEVQIGMTRVCEGGVFGVGQACWHELRGLQVASYAPSNPNNFYTQGDPFWSTIIGRNTAESWRRVTCPTGTVMSGYNIWARSNRVEKLQIQCRDLITGVNQNVGSPVGSTSLLFSDMMTCPDYVRSLNTNPKGDGLGGLCVRK